MRKIISSLALVLLGFWLYPLLFVPLMVKFAPGSLQKWVDAYANYLRMWGIS